MPSKPRPSALVQKIAGTYVADAAPPSDLLWQWIQAECRSGCFRAVLEEAAQREPEPVQVDLVLVERVDPDKIRVKIPCRVADHESRSTFAAEVNFEINPVTLTVTRVLT
jgi:hypothetical protein